MCCWKFPIAFEFSPFLLYPFFTGCYQKSSQNVPLQIIQWRLLPLWVNVKAFPMFHKEALTWFAFSPPPHHPLLSPSTLLTPCGPAAPSLPTTLHPHVVGCHVHVLSPRSFNVTHREKGTWRYDYIEGLKWGNGPISFWWPQPHHKDPGSRGAGGVRTQKVAEQH